MEVDKSLQRVARIGRQLQPKKNGSRRDSHEIQGRVEATPTLGVGLPALEIEKAFPQATPATTFPPAVSDYFQLDDLLSEEEKAIRNQARRFMETEVAPIIGKYWERAEFPFELIPKIATLNISGGTIKGYGCPGMSTLGSALVLAEFARVDASCSSFMLVQTFLGMLTIDMLASEEQKKELLPPLARLHHVASWGLTEPDYGSDASSLNTTATKLSGTMHEFETMRTPLAMQKAWVESGWLIKGQKRWIANASFADILVIFARNTQINQINGFIVRKGAKGLKATKIENKISLRVMQNCDIILDNVFVPDEDRLANVNSFRDISKVLAVARLMVAWQPIGISMGVYDVCHRYLQERKQFGVPLAAFQLNQEKLVRMLAHVQTMWLMGWRLCKLYDAGKMTHGHASLAKAHNTRVAREVCALGRELLGGNGILSDFNVAKAFCDIEPLYTYEGTYDVNSLITAREVTGVSSIKAHVSNINIAKRS